jgi:hypothetical protein
VRCRDRSCLAAATVNAAAMSSRRLSGARMPTGGMPTGRVPTCGMSSGMSAARMSTARVAATGVTAAMSFRRNAARHRKAEEERDRCRDNPVVHGHSLKRQSTPLAAHTTSSIDTERRNIRKPVCFQARPCGVAHVLLLRSNRRAILQASIARLGCLPRGPTEGKPRPLYS